MKAMTLKSEYAAVQSGRASRASCLPPTPTSLPQVTTSLPTYPPFQMLLDNFTIERLVISNTDMTEAGFTAVLAVLREGNNTVRDLSVGSQLLRSREVGGGWREGG